MTVSAPAWAPACMDPDEWALWERANRSLSSPFDRAVRPCADCPLGHAADMRAEGRCNGTPGGVDEEEPMDDVRTRVEAAATAKVAIALTAPCGPCGHAPVCRLRESVEAMARTTVAVPKLESGLAVELRGTIACGARTAADGRQEGRGRVMTETDGRWRHGAGDDGEGCILCWIDQDEQGLTGPNIRPCTTPEDDPVDPGLCRWCSHTVERAA